MRAFFIAAAFCLAISCQRTADLAGGTSSSENAKVNGTITDATGAPASGARVMLIPSGLNPALGQPGKSIARDTTNGAGAYAFDGIAPGTYNIQAASAANGTSLLITGIALNSKDSLTVPPDTLRGNGTIIVVFKNSPDSSALNVYIPGTTCFETVAANATSVAIDSVPCGTIPSVLMQKNGTSAPVLVGSNVSVQPSDTTYLSNSAKIYINTSSTGANVSQTITHFPLLVRLDSTFAFGQARPDGGDIRFAKQDGTPLHYEIARWDTAAKQAAVWVSVDTVYPNSYTQHITMSWGYSTLQSASNSAAVFTTSFGFAGVWHLEDAATALGTAMAFRDATNNAAWGSDFIAAVDRDGVVGLGHDFNGSDYILVSKQILSMASGDFTIALWANLRRERGALVSKDTATSQDSCARQLYLGDAPGDSSGLYPTFGGKACGTATANAAVSLNAWHYLAFTWSNGSKTPLFYIDGVQTGLSANSLTSGCPDNPRDRIVFGYDVQYLFGYLDEIHISGAARSAGWIKLSYENQRPGQTLVTIVQ